MQRCVGRPVCADTATLGRLWPETIDDHKENNSMYELRTELTGNVVFKGSYDECVACLKAFVTYGIREDKFEIVRF